MWTGSYLKAIAQICLKASQNKLKQESMSKKSNLRKQCYHFKQKQS